MQIKKPYNNIVIIKKKLKYTGVKYIQFAFKL